MKTDMSPKQAWQGLPLSPAQNREVLNYIQRCGRAGIDWALWPLVWACTPKALNMAATAPTASNFLTT